MNSGIKTLRDKFFQEALRDLLVPRLKGIIKTRKDGHCMRLSDLDTDLMVLICSDIRKEIEPVQIYILDDPDISRKDAEDPSVFVSSTKLVELRNPLPDGSLRPPLLVLIPFNLHTSAEDLFGLATFEDISISDIYKELVQSQLPRIPVPLQGHTNGILKYLNQENWPWANHVAQARFILTSLQNGIDGESIGSALYELGLIPDFHLFDDPSITLGRVKKNLDVVRNITYSTRSIRGRVLDLHIKDLSLQHQLLHLLDNEGVENPQSWTKVVSTDRNYWNLSFHNWQFSDNQILDKLSIRVISTDLPTISENEADVGLQSLVGQFIFLPHKKHSIKIKFEVDPQPNQFTGLGYFSVQIISVNDGQIGVAKTVKCWQGNQKSKTVTITKLNQDMFDEGWHFVRILAWTDANDPIPLSREEIEDSQSAPNESDPFYVALEKDVIEEQPEQRAIQRELSLEHAKLSLKFSALINRHKTNDISPNYVAWSDVSSRKLAGSQQMILIDFGQSGKIHVPVPNTFKRARASNSSSGQSPFVMAIGYQ